MLAFDTNVLVRVLVSDDARQTATAEAALREASDAGGVWIGQIVLVETAWVLARSYRFDRTRVAECVGDLLDSPVFVLEERDRVERALASYSSSAADFSDCLVLESARDAGALPLLTFDAKLARQNGARELPSG